MKGILLLCLALLTTYANAARNFTSSELDTLVSTIALYPDPLLVHVLTASTYGEQIPGANAWSQEHKNLTGEELASAMERANLPYDPSVQALIPFPTVLETMAKYRTWCDQLGDAVSVQKEDVMDAVQRLRTLAYDHGQLKTNEQVRVEKGNTIVIEPVRTEYVYVPVYNPRVVYYVYADDYPSIRYHHRGWLGSWFGEWGWGSCWFEWDSHFIYVRDYRWYHHRPIPRHPRRYSPPPRPRRMEPARGFHQPPPSRREELRREESRREEPRRWESRWLDDDRHSEPDRAYKSSESSYNYNRSEPEKAYGRSDDQDRNFKRNGSWEDRKERQSPPSSSNKNSNSSSISPSKKHPASGGNGGFTRVKR